VVSLVPRTGRPGERRVANAIQNSLVVRDRAATERAIGAKSNGRRGGIVIHRKARADDRVDPKPQPSLNPVAMAMNGVAVVAGRQTEERGTSIRGTLSMDSVVLLPHPTRTERAISTRARSSSWSWFL